MNFENKAELRVTCKKIRSSLDISVLSENICKNIKKWNVYSTSKNILIFYPIGSEISLLKLLSDISHNFYFPCVVENDLYIAKYDKNLGFSDGKFGIKEPVTPRLSNADFIDLALIPALAVDQKGYRLGYGKGFYDRFLTKYPNITKAVPVSKCLVFDEIPSEDHDVKVNYVITESGIIDFRCQI